MVLADLIAISSKDFFVNNFDDECRTYPSSPRKRIAKQPWSYANDFDGIHITSLTM
jgi:hypothetical protein